MEKSNPSQDAQGTGSENLDFDSAEMFLAMAREAYESKDEKSFIVARKMFMVALGIQDEGRLLVAGKR